MNTYKTTELAKIIGIHPNTVMLYEEWKLIPKVARKGNGYRIFTDFHIDQFRLARAALQVKILQNGLCKKAINIIKTSAQKDFVKAICMTEEYLSQIQQGRFNAEEAIEGAVAFLLSEHSPPHQHIILNGFKPVLPLKTQQIHHFHILINLY